MAWEACRCLCQKKHTSFDNELGKIYIVTNTRYFRILHTNNVLITEVLRSKGLEFFFVICTYDIVDLG